METGPRQMTKHSLGAGKFFFHRFFIKYVIYIYIFPYSTSNCLQVDYAYRMGMGTEGSWDAAMKEEWYNDNDNRAWVGLKMLTTNDHHDVGRRWKSREMMQMGSCGCRYVYFLFYSYILLTTFFLGTNHKWPPRHWTMMETLWNAGGRRYV